MLLEMWSFRLEISLRSIHLRRPPLGSRYDAIRRPAGGLDPEPHLGLCKGHDPAWVVADL